jgi:hypothetical protein
MRGEERRNDVKRGKEERRGEREREESGDTEDHRASIEE